MLFAEKKSAPTYVAAAMALATALGAASVARANDWSSLGLDPGRGRSTDEKAGASFTSAWNANPAGSALVASPLVVDGLVVVAGARGEVSALRASDGSSVWSVTAAGGVAASPTIANGRVFIPTLRGQLQALRLGSGAQVWKRPLGGSNYGSPVVIADGLGTSLVLGAGFPAQKVVRLSATTGDTQWETAPDAVGGLVSSSVAVSGSQLLFGMNGGRYQSLDAQKGVTNWRAETRGDVGMSAPLVVGTTAFFLPGGSTSALYAANVATGELLANWPVSVVDAAAPAPSDYVGSRHAVSSPALLGGLVVFVERFEYDLYAPAKPYAGLHTLREYVVAVEPTTAQVAWQRELGHRDVASMNDVPELNLSPTPVAFATAGNPLVAVASSVAPAVGVYDLGGVQVWAGSLSAPTRSSPVLANGMLLVATDTGVVNAFASDVNHAPVVAAAGFSPADGEAVADASPSFKWPAATDAEGQDVRYQVRVVAADGDLRDAWLQQIDTAAGATSAVLDRAAFQVGPSYRFSVRARDSFGAWSDWSAEHAFTLAPPAKIEVDGKTYATLDDAVAAVPVTGGVVDLGAGVVRLRAPLSVPAGVTLRGAGALQTTIDATGLATGLKLTAAAGRSGAPAVSNATVTGADVGIQIVDAQNAVLRNLVVRDNKKVGVQVDEAAVVDGINLTLARNGAGAAVAGKLSLRSSIVTDNGTGLARVASGLVTSRYNDVVANKTMGYDGVVVGTGDIEAPVTFHSAADFRLLGFQATTDKGDPSDEYGLEPQPNGARVNMGAFGNTASAELSQSSAGWAAAANTPAAIPADPTAAPPAPRPDNMPAAPDSTTPPLGAPPLASSSGGPSQPNGSPSPVGDPTGPTTAPHSGGGGCAVAGDAPAHPGSTFFAWLAMALGAVLVGRRRK
jgi:MYXO-CTERM domain-containing protein